MSLSNPSICCTCISPLGTLVASCDVTLVQKIREPLKLSASNNTHFNKTKFFNTCSNRKTQKKNITKKKIHTKSRILNPLFLAFPHVLAASMSVHCHKGILDILWQWTPIKVNQDTRKPQKISDFYQYFRAIRLLAASNRRHQGRTWWHYHLGSLQHHARLLG